MYGYNINKLGKKEKNAKVKEGPCIIPFMYKWKEQKECFPTDKGDICATSVTPRNTLKTYGYCTKLSEAKNKSPANKTRKVMKLKRIKIKKPNIITMVKKTTYNDVMIKSVKEIHDYLMKKGEPFRARAYKKAYETLMSFPDDITKVEQIKGKPGIGEAIYKRLQELVSTGKIEALERYRKDPMFIFSDIYGIGPKKAKELVQKDKITSISQLRENTHLLNEKQKVGLQYYEDILERIPRSEIVEFEKTFNQVFESVKYPESTFEIVGSYRRGAKDSGDIDVIITDMKNQKDVFEKFLKELEKTGVIVYFLSKGKTKSLVVGKLPGGKYARRLDFLYSTPKEYPFSVLYFTGSALFNTLMRNQALKLGYTMNEHTLADKVTKEPLTDVEFKSEEDIFNFLQLEYVEPNMRNTSKHFKVIEKKEVATMHKTIKQKKNTMKHVKEFIAHGASVLSGLSEDELGQMMVKANDAYYNDSPIMSDGQFDVLKEHIEEKYPKSAYLLQIGAPITSGKVKLPYFMGSMDKIKPDTKILDKWLTTYKGPYVVSTKLDGISALFVNTPELGTKLYTRGDGTYGQDITHMIPYLKLPVSTENIVLRGELIMKKDTFNDKYSKKYANARNFVAGLSNAKKPDYGKIKDVDFVGYEVIVPTKTPRKQFELMTSLSSSLITAKHSFHDKLDKEIMSDILLDWRSNYEYEIDGIIATNNKKYERTEGNPKHSVAFKMVLSEQVVEAKVLDVIWTASKHGFLKPRIRIEPVTIGGARIEYATAFNAAFVRDNKIGVGAVISLIRSGDVIPYIQEVITPASAPLMPVEDYEWNDTNIDIILKNKSGNKTVIIKQLVAFFKGLEVEGLSEGNLTKLVNAGYDSLSKILSMKMEDFMGVPTFKLKKSTKVYNSIHEKMATITLPKLAALSNSFGRGFGIKRMESLLTNYPDVFTDTLSNYEKIKKIKTIEGFSQKIATNVIENIDAFKDFTISIGRPELLTSFKIATPKVKDHELNGKSIVITGFRSKELEEKIKDVGGKIGTSVSKKTFAVVVSNLDEETGKMTKAKKVGVPIFTRENFEKEYKL
jgi:DNA ligase (NAD+)